MIDDFGLIVSSFRAQYGVRLASEANEMSWDEFRDLLSGLGPETPLGRMVSIRSEDDPAMLENFTPEQHTIRSQWLNRRAKERSPDECEHFLTMMKETFKAMAGGDANGG